MSSGSPRHAPSRAGRRGLAAAGVAGVSAALAVAPVSAAEAATPAPPTPTTSPASTNTAVTSPTPTAPSATTPTQTASSPTAPKARAAIGAVTPIYGTQKYRVGVQLATGAYVAPGVATTGSVLQIQLVKPDGTDDGAPQTCTTDPVTLTGTTTFCNQGGPFGENFPLPQGDKAVITQISAPTGLVVDPTPQTVGPCVVAAVGDTCANTDVVFSDTGPAPIAVNDTAFLDVIPSRKSIDIPVLANDNLQGAPVTGLTVAVPPAHGTATVVTVGSTQQIRYTPSRGFVGKDNLTYKVSTGNGSSTAAVDLTVVAAPVASPDHVKIVVSPAQKSVTIPVLANDFLGGGQVTALTVSSGPSHGTATVAGKQVTYTPTAGYTGDDSFTYTVRTKYGSSTAIVHLVVTAATNVGPAVNTGADVLPPTASTGIPWGEDAALVGAGLLLIVGGLRFRKARA